MQGTEAKAGRRPGVPFRQGDKIYTPRPQSINTAISVRGNGGIATHNENFCHELINYAVRIGKCLFMCNVHGPFHVRFVSVTITEVHGNFHVPCHMFHRKVHGNFHVPCRLFDRKVHGNFHVRCHMFRCTGT